MFAIGGNLDGARRMAPRRYIQKFFFFPNPLRGFRVVLVPHNLVRVPDVNIVVMKGDAKRIPQTIRKRFPLLRAPRVFRIPQNLNAPRSGFRNEQISVWRYRQQSRRLEILRVYIDVEPIGYRRQESVRAADLVGTVSG